ncbi:mechanosensitive ion channel family protein [Sediminicola luteus]|uniref:Mechanosensing system component YbdG n=1 Tax=Sediminicola luteus TaxID=319238 RepID=A0A2A4G7T7_9FLAO|nr:mechanosensitive ion channel domain-containing protein [Sediminicola luteus]PCE63812.1 mechanosensitive ion channel protein MscS [Sediminicola luteus]
MQDFTHFLYEQLVEWGVSTVWAKYVNVIVLLVILLLAMLLLDFLIRKILVGTFERFTSKSKNNFDDFLVRNRAPRNIAHIIPLLLAYELAPSIFQDFEYAETLIMKTIEVIGIILTLRIIRSLLNTMKDFFKTLPNLKDKPIDSYLQVFMIFSWFVGFMFAFSIITSMKLMTFLTTLGAASAVILLVFKDTILGFVASIQVSINDMVRIGDWITFEKYGADGDVIEINLATVKVQNFDKTITTIPTYALISDSFRNWRGMMNAQGRRIKRALIVKQESIKFLDAETVNKLRQIQLIDSYLENKQTDISAYNEKNGIDTTLPINGRQLTNLGTFRKYIDRYLNQHSGINKDMMIMVRQLAPTSQGIPLEVYAFSADKRWENYEYIMADIFDHILAALPYFELELFELPSSSTFEQKTVSLQQ